MTARRALVLGGSGAVGREVVRALRARGLAVDFTFLRREDEAAAIAGETGARAHAVDLRDATATRAWALTLDPAPDLLVHCAAVGHLRALAETTIDDWDEALAVNARAPFVVCRALAASLRDVVLVGALDRSQSLPLPVAYAASQGALGSLAGALAKALGPSGTRVNLVALGPLDAGLGTTLDEKRRDDYRTFSALRRIGTSVEAARAIAWIAVENSYMSGKVLAVNGGI